MADTKGSQLPTLLVMSDDDIFVTVDNPQVAPATRKITLANVKKSLYRFSEVQNVNYDINATDLVVALTSTLTVVRTIKLPFAASVPSGYSIVVVDMSGTANLTNYLSITANTGDTVNGDANAIINNPYGFLTFISNGVDKWAYNDPNVSSLNPQNNLSDLLSASTARSNLGLGSAATQPASNFLTVANNLSEVTGATARANLGLGTMAVETATNYLPKSGNLSGLANAGTARTNLGLGTMATETASDYLAKTGNLSGLSNAGTARTNLGLGDAAVKNTGTTAGTVAAGDDSRLSNNLRITNNLVDLDNVATARFSLAIDDIATKKSNLTATTNPDLNDDVGDGYAIGSVWINVSTDTVFMCVDSTAAAAVWRDISTVYSSLGITISGGGATITTGIKGYLTVPYACKIISNTLLANQSGSIVIDVWKDTYANFPPVDADSITASAPPTLSSAQKSTDATLTGWTTTLAAGDILAFNVDSASAVELVHLSLRVEKL